MLRSPGCADVWIDADAVVLHAQHERFALDELDLQAGALGMNAGVTDRLITDTEDLVAHVLGEHDNGAGDFEVQRQSGCACTVFSDVPKPVAEVDPGFRAQSGECRAAFNDGLGEPFVDSGYGLFQLRRIGVVLQGLFRDQLGSLNGLQQGVVQVARDAGALLQPRFVEKLEAALQLPDANPIKQGQERQRDGDA